MPTPNPRPVYLVEPPPPSRSFGDKIGQVIAAAVVIVVLVVVATAFLPALGGSDPLASFRATNPPATSAGPATPDPAAVGQAGFDAIDRMQAKLDAKSVACGALNGAANTKCNSEYLALSRALDQLTACVDNATTLAAVATCAKKAGV